MSTASKLDWTCDPISEFCRFSQNAPIGLAQFENGNLTAMNPALEQMFGGAIGTTAHLTFDDIIHSKNDAENVRLTSELLDGRRNCIQIESTIPSDESQRARWTAWSVPSGDSSDDIVLATAELISVAPSIEERLRQAERLEAVGRLAGGVAHDFNNLLTGVLLYCDLLMATMDPGHRARKYAEEIRKAGMQATGLVRQLLAVAKPSRGEPQLISLNEIAEGMRNFLSRLIGENIDVTFCLDPNLGLIKMDPAQAQQILLNLVLNARDAMPAGGRISVATSNCNVQMLGHGGPGTCTQPALPCALLSIEDNGIGMDSATKSHLFEPFFTTKAGKGTGLGLTTVHGVVSKSGGLIHVDSEPGRGTRISVLLPLAPDVSPEPSRSHDFYPMKDGEVPSLKEEE